MRKIHTLDINHYMNNNPVGRKTGHEVFDLLNAHLKSVNLLPDEYFIPSSYSNLDHELPDYREAICHTNWGGNEGIYISISLKYYENDKVKEMPFATGKTLGASGEDFIRMSRIAAECSMMLNGYGAIVKVPEHSYPKDLDALNLEQPGSRSTHTNENTLDIYQLKSGDFEIEKLWFRNYDFLKQHNYKIDVNNYDLVYSGPIGPGETLEGIYHRFNFDHPEGFKGHSLSVSDVVALKQNGTITFHFTDSFGFREIPDFIKEPQRPQSLDTQIRKAEEKSQLTNQEKSSEPER